MMTYILISAISSYLKFVFPILALPAAVILRHLCTVTHHIGSSVIICESRYFLTFLILTVKAYK